MTDLPSTAAEMCRAMAEGWLKPSEVMEATLDRIDAVNPKVNAIVALRPREEYPFDFRRIATHRLLPGELAEGQAGQHER